jgi:two-component SAPR family response regulator
VDFLDGLKVKPQIVFITSKAEYAMKALMMMDYLQNLLQSIGSTHLKRAIDLHLLKKENKEEEGEHIL